MYKTLKAKEIFVSLLLIKKIGQGFETAEKFRKFTILKNKSLIFHLMKSYFTFRRDIMDIGAEIGTKNKFWARLHFFTNAPEFASSPQLWVNSRLDWTL